MKYKWGNTAAFDVDAQKGFTPVCPNELPVPEGDLIVEALNEQAKYARLRLASKDAHCRDAIWIANEEKKQFDPVDGGVDSDIHWNSHCIMGTEGAELLDGLPDIKDYDFFVWKGIEPGFHPYGAVYHTLDDKLSTGVIEFLRGNQIHNVIVGGLAENYCVATTVKQLHGAGFKVILNREACKAIPDGKVEEVVQDLVDNYMVKVINKTEELKDLVED